MSELQAWEPSVGSVVFHAKALFGPGTVLDAREDVELEARLFTVLWQRTGQKLEHTAQSLRLTPADLAGGVS